MVIESASSSSRGSSSAPRHLGSVGLRYLAAAGAARDRPASTLHCVISSLAPSPGPYLVEYEQQGRPGWVGMIADRYNTTLIGQEFGSKPKGENADLAGCYLFCRLAHAEHVPVAVARRRIPSLMNNSFVIRLGASHPRRQHARGREGAQGRGAPQCWREVVGGEVQGAIDIGGPSWLSVNEVTHTVS